MARLKLSSLLADMRGRLGSSVISSNGAGAYVKSFKVPVNPRSEKQESARDMFARCSWAWTAITSANRLTWTAYAADPSNTRYDWFGDPYLPNARAQFFSINTARLLAGDDIAEDAPTGALPAVLPALQAGIDPSGLLLTSYLNPLDVFDASIYAVHATTGYVSSTGRTSPPLPLRFLGIHLTGDTWPWEFQSEITDLWGPIPVQGTWWMQVTPLSDEFRPGSTVILTAPMGQEN